MTRSIYLMRVAVEKLEESMSLPLTQIVPIYEQTGKNLLEHTRALITVTQQTQREFREAIDHEKSGDPQLPSRIKELKKTLPERHVEITEAVALLAKFNALSVRLQCNGG